MNNINRLNSEYELFKRFHSALSTLNTDLSHELSHCAFDDDSSTAQKLFLLKDIINSGIKLCGENIFQDIQIMLRELTGIKGEIEFGR